MDSNTKVCISMNTYKPTRLYVKKHTVTGLRYFGKSIREDIYEYNGSGKHWARHIKKHGKEHVITEWVSDWFYTVEDIGKFALAFSEVFNIVDNIEWANLKEENGLDGGSMGIDAVNKRHKTISNPEWRESTGKEAAKRAARKISETMHSLEWKESVGKEARKKQVKSVSETMNNPEWRLLHSKTCEHCDKTISSTNYTRWHGKNCKTL